MRSHLTIALLTGKAPQPLELDSETSISLQWQSPFFHAQRTFTYDFTVPATPANLAATLRAAGTPTLHEGLPPLPARLQTPLGSWDGELTVTDASPLRITLSFVYLEPWVRAAQAVPLSAVNFSTGPGHPGCRYLKDETVAYLQCRPDDTRTNPVYYAVGLVHAVRRILTHLGLPYDSAFWDAQQHLETLYLVTWAPNAHGCWVYNGSPGTDIRLPSSKSCYEILLGVAAVLNAVWVWHQGRLILYCPGQGYYTRAAVRPWGRAWAGFLGVWEGEGAVAAGRGFGVVGDEGDRGRASARDGAQEREDAEPIGRGEGGYPEKSLPLRAARRWGLGAD